MASTVIRVEGLSKRYRVGAKKERYRTLRDVIAEGFKGSRRNAPAANRSSADHIWALRDIHYDVQSGDVVGIIGRNGAGKSTLLKTLARITEPTEGSVEIRGRVASLLEVGTGFHQELTGRENIYLNGVILGMRRAEIERKFDEIVAFSEVERFLDTPIKHYSTGMNLRLAFSVAAFLEPEILIIDEVLAVGDVGFQKKCLGRMGDLASQGRTVLFVSHNLGAVRAFCTRGMLLESGRILESGEMGKTLEAYLRMTSLGGSDGDFDVQTNGETAGLGPVVLVRSDGQQHAAVSQSEEIGLATVLTLDQHTGGFMTYCTLEDALGRIVFNVRQDSRDLGLTEASPGRYDLALRLPPLWLSPGIYSLRLKVFPRGTNVPKKYASERLTLDIAGESSSTDSLLHPQARWRIQKASS